MNDNEACSAHVPGTFKESITRSPKLYEAACAGRCTRASSETEIEQANLLAYNTCGWPRMVRAWRWMREQLAWQHTSNREKHASAGD